jgi:hypothetical protein
MRFKVKQQAITSTSTLVTKYWNLESLSMGEDGPWHIWRKDCGLDIFMVLVDKTHPELPPRLHDMGKLHGWKPC